MVSKLRFFHGSPLLRGGAAGLLLAALLSLSACGGGSESGASVSEGPTGVAPAEPDAVAETSAPGEYDLYRQGREHWYKEEWSNAAAAFKEHIERFPNSPRRCRSENYLGYCYRKLGRDRDAVRVLTELIRRADCPAENLDDAKAELLELAYSMLDEDPSMKKVLLGGLNDDNIDIRLAAASWLSELNDAAGVPVFFEVVRLEKDQDRKNTAINHILKVGSDEDKARLQEILDKQSDEPQAPKMVRMIIRDLKTGKEHTKINLPIGLFNVLVKSLNDEQIKLIEEDAGIDLRNFRFNLEDLPSGKVLFRVVDESGQEIKVFLE